MEIYVSTDVETDGPIPGVYSMLSIGSAAYLPDKTVFVPYPAGFDFMYVCWYLNRFTGENPFGWHALDIKTFAMALTGRDFLDTVKRNMPRQWFDDLPYTHKAMDDAVSQGVLFCNMLAEHKRRLKAE